MHGAVVLLVVEVACAVVTGAAALGLVFLLHEGFVDGLVFLKWFDECVVGYVFEDSAA